MTHAREDIRIAVSAACTVVLLLTAALGSLATAGEDGIGAHAIEGVGIGAVLTVLVALGLADAAARQWGTPNGAGRTPVIYIGIAGIIWCCVRVGLGDVWIVPGLVGLSWCVVLASLCVQPDDDTPHPEE